MHHITKIGSRNKFTPYYENKLLNNLDIGVIYISKGGWDDLEIKEQIVDGMI